MAKQRVQQPPIRKSFLIFGAIVLGVAVVGFVLMNVVGGSEPTPSPVTPGSGQNGVAPAPATQEEPRLREGGRNPFQPVVNLAAAAAPSAPEPTAAPARAADPGVASTDGGPKTLIGLQAIHDGLADLTFVNSELRNVKPGTTLQPAPALPDAYVLERVTGDCAFVKRGVEIRRVCVGETIVL